jgi:manganese efflux pump family protein
MRGSVAGAGQARPAARVALPAAGLALLAAVLAAGCSAAHPPAAGSLRACSAFGVLAIERRVTVVTVPPACSGLDRAQVDQAMASAIRVAVGPHAKAAGRRLAYRDGKYLAHLIAPLPPPGPAPLAVAPARQPSATSLAIAALAAWIATVAAGGYLLMAGWLAGAGPRRGILRAAARLPAVVVGHFALALTGLAIWIAFLATGTPALAWIATGLIVVIAGLGMGALVTDIAGSSRARAPVLSIAAHGALASATILLVVLAAVGAA